VSFSRERRNLGRRHAVNQELPSDGDLGQTARQPGVLRRRALGTRQAARLCHAACQCTCSGVRDGRGRPARHGDGYL